MALPTPYGGCVGKPARGSDEICKILISMLFHKVFDKGHVNAKRALGLPYLGIVPLIEIVDEFCQGFFVTNSEQFLRLSCESVSSLWMLGP